MKTKFESLVGQEFGFYGVDNNAFKIGRFVFEALEDEDDGYRSYLGSVEVKDPEGLIFFGRSVAKVRLEEYSFGDFEGYRLVDVVGGHVWLKFGTDHAYDYYPCFIFEYLPKEKS